jgi:hypothetical protein
MARGTGVESAWIGALSVRGNTRRDIGEDADVDRAVDHADQRSRH